MLLESYPRPGYLQLRTMLDSTRSFGAEHRFVHLFTVGVEHWAVSTFSKLFLISFKRFWSLDSLKWTFKILVVKDWRLLICIWLIDLVFMIVGWTLNKWLINLLPAEYWFYLLIHEFMNIPTEVRPGVAFISPRVPKKNSAHSVQPFGQL